MINNNETKITKGSAGNKLLVTRSFNAPVEKVWEAWTNSRILDQWWAPKPWKAVTVVFDFSEGGHWLYYMLGPEGERHYCRADYKAIEPLKSYIATDAFTDENGVPNNMAPSAQWENTFTANDDKTDLSIEITYPTEADLETIVSMGFKEGFSMGLSNLDELLAK
ncbi:SRPBCC family protein [Flavobacterium psychrotrophum]|uniref:SRPBCC family protein n=1 Tax=Flavobacterium psychrotrophum TaxID=2294119 RepID=UPI000E316355|nr:SRPBCC domain-containing protein [Flavobacterium psychrotrophum]